MKLKDKVTVITGAGSGIGRATALLFTQEGAKVVVADYSVEGGEETVRQITEKGGEAIFVKVDVSQAIDAQKMVETAINKYGRLDVLYNNAGIEGLMDHLDGTYSAWMKDIVLAQAKILAPQQYLERAETGFTYNVDKMVFAKLDMDPTDEGNKITAV